MMHRILLSYCYFRKYCCHSYLEIALSGWNIGSNTVINWSCWYFAHRHSNPHHCVLICVHQACSSLCLESRKQSSGAALMFYVFICTGSLQAFFSCVSDYYDWYKYKRLASFKNVERKCAWVLKIYKRVFNGVFQQLNEWSSSYFSNHRKQCWRNSCEEHSFSYVGYWWSRVSAVILEHLLFKHRGTPKLHLNLNFKTNF